MFVVKTSKGLSEGAPNVSIQIQQYEEDTGKYGLKDMNTALQRSDLESPSVSNTGSSGDIVLQSPSTCEAIVQDIVTVSESSETYLTSPEADTSAKIFHVIKRPLTSVNQNQEEPYVSNEVVVCNTSSTEDVHAIQRLLSYNMEKSGPHDESQSTVVNITEIPEMYVDNILVIDADQVQKNLDGSTIINNFKVDPSSPMEGIYQNVLSSEVDRVQQVKKQHISSQPQCLKKFTAEDLKAIGTTKEDIMKPCYGRNKSKKVTKKEASNDLQEKPVEMLDTGNVSDTSQLEETSKCNEMADETATKKDIISDADTEKVEKDADDSESFATPNESCSEELTNESIVKPSTAKLGSRKRKIEDDGDDNEFRNRQTEKTAKQEKISVTSEDEGGLGSVNEEESKTVETTDIDDQTISEPCEIDNDIKQWQDIYKCTHTADRCVIEIAPILSNIIKDKQCVIEVQVEDILQVKQFSKKESVGGLTRYCLLVSNPNDTSDMSEVGPRSPKQVKEVEKRFNLRKRKKTKSNYNAQPVRQSVRKCQKTTKQTVKNENTAKSGRRGRQSEDDWMSKKEVGPADEIDNKNVENTLENENQHSEIGRSKSAKSTVESGNEENLPGGSTLKTDDKPKSTGKKKASGTSKTNKKKGKQEARKAKRSKAAQNYHTRITEEGQKVFSCKFCAYSTKASRDIAIHYYQHTDERPFQCEICGQAFKGPSNLANHKKLHSSEMYYSCQLCEKQFKDRGNYKQHMRRHIGDKKHVCKHCEMSFVTTSDLKKHQRVHTGEKPYKCDLCIKRFGDKSSLLRHKNLHTPRYRFECEVCGKSFSRRDLCITHVKNVHKIENDLPINKIFVDEEVSRSYSESEIITKLVQDYNSTTNEYEDVVPKNMTENVAPKIVKANIVKKYSNENMSDLHVNECSSAEYVFESVGENVIHENSSTKLVGQETTTKHVDLEINKKLEEVSPQHTSENLAHAVKEKTNSKLKSRVMNTNSSNKSGNSKTAREGIQAKDQSLSIEPVSTAIGTKTVSQAVCQTPVFQGSCTSAQGVINKSTNSSSNSFVQQASLKTVRTGNSIASVSQGTSSSAIHSDRKDQTSADQKISSDVVCESQGIKANAVKPGINTKLPSQKRGYESVGTQHASQGTGAKPFRSIGQELREKYGFQVLPQQSAQSAQNYGFTSTSTPSSHYQNAACEKKTMH